MSNEILKNTELIQETDELINKYLDQINEILSDKELKNIFYKYNQNQEEHKDSGFNIFNLISDKYYYENLHSDIISVFLDREGTHKEGSKFLNIFIEFLNNLSGLRINLDDFKNSTIARENFRIDILIRGKSDAIIIENKINNARDTKKQLPTYVKKIREENKNIVAIVYLPLDPNKREPADIEEWEEEDKIFIRSKLICLPAFNRTDNDFFNGWLLPCIESANGDVKTILKQYSKLILKIGGFIMDKSLFGKFYDKAIVQNDFFKMSLLVSEFINRMPKYRAEKIKDSFLNEPSPFKKVFCPNDTTVYFSDYKKGERSFKIHLNCHIDKYELKFYDDDYEEIINNEPVNIKYTQKIIENLKDVKFTEKREDEFVKWFSFPEEEQNLYNYIAKLRDELKDISLDV